MPKKQSPLWGDEGMWLLNQLPFDRIKERYGEELPKDFGERVMRAAVRINSGGSASFVSKNGLIITNHHVAHGLVAALSTEDNDLVKNGFYAPTRKAELKIPQLEINIIDSIEDVTVRILKKKGDARKAEIAAIEIESKKKTGLRSDVVELYQGGAYHVYRYQRYTDIRLVFVPEKDAASFGGDFDNYEFPRYCLDIAFLRAYDDSGKPVVPREHFTMSAAPLEEEKLLFVAGHPGHTDRLTSYAALLDIRDHGLPNRLASLRRMEISYMQYAGRSPEFTRRAEREIATVTNLRKRYIGQLAALQDPLFMARAKQREDVLRNAVRKSSALKKKVGDPWSKIEKALTTYNKLFIEYELFEVMIGFGGHYDGPKAMRSNWTTYLGIARTIVRLVTEDKKPSGKRLPEYADARRQSLLEALYSPAPIYNDLEEWKLRDTLGLLLETYGTKDVLVNTILGGTSPETRARELIQSTSLEDPENRKRLVRGGMSAVKKSKDPLIKLALLIDARARAVRTKMGKKVKSQFEDAYAKIATALFETYGTDVYPDATFTLRLAYGSAKSHAVGDEELPHYTSISGVLPHGAKHDNQWPWELPKSWTDAHVWVKGSHVPYNFITTHDSHGGNSGSPVFTKGFEFVGILFDGISSGQGSTFMYGDYERTVCVASSGILEILKNVYHADALVIELTH